MIEIPAARRPESVATDDKVFVVYGDIANNAFAVKIFDQDMNTEISSKILVTESASYGKPTDSRITSDNEYLYLSYETADSKSGTSYLFAEKYTLDDNFEKVASTGLISMSTSLDSAEYGDEKLDDPIPMVGGSSVFVITRFKDILDMSGETRYKVYEFTKDLSKIKEFEIDLSSVADGGARQASAIYHDGYFYMVLPTTVGQAGPIALATISDIVMVKLDNNWNIVESKIISADPEDVETYVSGFQADDSNFYITYNQRDAGEFSSPLKIYDKEFDLLINEKVRVKRPEEPGLRPSLEVTSDRILVGNAAGEFGNSDGEIFIYKIKR